MDRIDTYEEMASTLERILNKYSKHDKKPQQYCEGIYLTQTEIDTMPISCKSAYFRTTLYSNYTV